MAWAFPFAAALAAAAPLAGAHPRRLDAISVRASDWTEVVLGAELSSVPCSRGGADRRGFARSGLPKPGLGVAFRQELASRPGWGDFQGPLVTGGGDILVVAPDGSVVSVSPTGEVRRRVETGADGSGPPAILSDGTIVLLGHDGDLVGVRGQTVVFRTPLAFKGERLRDGSTLPLSDGGALVALPSSREWVSVARDGQIRMRRQPPEPLATPAAQWGRYAIGVGTGGAVYAWDGVGALRTLGRFDAAPASAITVSDHQVLAAVRGVIEAVDLASGELSVVSEEPLEEVRGPLALNDSGGLSLFASSGALLTLQASAQGASNSRRYHLTNSTPAPRSGQSQKPSADVWDPGPLLSASGVAMFATSDGAVVRVHGGESESVGPFCNSAGNRTAGIAATPDGAVALLCTNGVLTLVRGEFRLAIQKNPG